MSLHNTFYNRQAKPGPAYPSDIGASFKLLKDILLNIRGYADTVVFYGKECAVRLESRRDLWFWIDPPCPDSGFGL